MANDPQTFENRLIAALEEQTAFLKNIARDMQSVKSEFSKVVNYMHDAESEVPEKMRRFIMYFHDAHDLQNLYHEQGAMVPPWVTREVERCADRFRHLVEDLEKPGETFEKVRREMTNRPDNRYDHTRMLPKQEKSNEAGNGKDTYGGSQGRTEVQGGQPGSGVGHRESGGSDEVQAPV